MNKSAFFPVFSLLFVSFVFFINTSCVSTKQAAEWSVLKLVKSDFSRSADNGESEIHITWTGGADKKQSPYPLAVIVDWYESDAAMKADDNNYEITATGNNLRFSGWTAGGSVEAGWQLRTDRWGVVEPQARLDYQACTIFAKSDYFHRTFAFEDSDSTLGQVAVRWHGELKIGRTSRLRPWARVAGAYEFSNKYDIVIRDIYGDPSVIANDLGGGQFIVGAGLIWAEGEQFSLSVNGAYGAGKYYNGYTISGGLRFVW
jgi:outer membrane autotransporter protein